AARRKRRGGPRANAASACSGSQPAPGSADTARSLVLCPKQECSLEPCASADDGARTVGIDWLAITCRVHREFGRGLGGADFASWLPEARRADGGTTEGPVASKLQADGAALPPDGWERPSAVSSESLNVRARRTSPQSRRYADLGMLD